jgi:twinkle protein
MAGADIVNLDALRLRQVGRVLVTGAPELRLEDLPVIDPAKFDPKAMLDAYNNEQSKFATTPFDPTGSRLRLYPGGVTIWSGYPGAGKTTLLRQLACHLLHRGESVFFASFEEHPQHLVVRIASSAAGMQTTDVERLTWFCDWYAEKFRVWGVVGDAKSSQILGAIQATKCTHSIIDSLMCFEDIADDDYNAQKLFVNRLAQLATLTGQHIHLVAHPRKVISTSQQPDINDVAGARAIAGRADNVLFVRRSSKEQQDTERLGMLVCILKQRHEGGLGDIAGWYQRNWRQFSIDQFPQAPVHYLPAEAFA